MKKAISMITGLGLLLTLNFSTVLAGNRVAAGKSTPNNQITETNPPATQDKNLKVSNRVPASKRGTKNQVIPEHDTTSRKKKGKTNRVPASKQALSENKTTVAVK